MVRKLDVILPLVSSIIIGGISFFQNDSLSTMILKLIIVIIVFYLLGFILRLMIEKINSNLNMNNENEEIIDKDLTNK